MNRIQITLTILTLAVVLVSPGLASACPSCQDAPAAGSSGGDDEGILNPAAYNNSIYVMVGVPYTCLACGAFMVYRGMKKNEEFRRTQGWGDETRG
jgi:hypothetical protein